MLWTDPEASTTTCQLISQHGPTMSFLQLHVACRVHPFRGTELDDVETYWDVSAPSRSVHGCSPEPSVSCRERIKCVRETLFARKMTPEIFSKGMFWMSLVRECFYRVAYENLYNTGFEDYRNCLTFPPNSSMFWWFWKLLKKFQTKTWKCFLN